MTEVKFITEQLRQAERVRSADAIVFWGERLTHKLTHSYVHPNLHCLYCPGGLYEDVKV